VTWHRASARRVLCGVRLTTCPHTHIIAITTLLRAPPCRPVVHASHRAEARCHARFQIKHPHAPPARTPAYTPFMDTTTRGPVAAAFLALVAVVLSTASLTIAIISAASPPIVRFGTPPDTWKPIVMATVVLGFVALNAGQAILRRPLVVSTARYCTRVPLLLAALPLIALLPLGWLLLPTYGSLGADPAVVITDSPSFPRLGAGFAMAAAMVSTSSSILLARWWCSNGTPAVCRPVTT
jgi:hypothetical protein